VPADTGSYFAVQALHAGGCSGPPARQTALGLSAALHKTWGGYGLGGARHTAAAASKHRKTGCGSGRIKQVARQDPRRAGWRPGAGGVH